MAKNIVMKFDLFSEMDSRLRRFERRGRLHGDADRYQYELTRSGVVGVISRPLPKGSEGKPTIALRYHRDHMGGHRWVELENLILNYKRTQSFEKRRTGFPTYPTLLAPKYASQIDMPWPEFLPLAKHILDFLEIVPDYRSMIMPARVMIAQYLVKFKLSPSWVGDLYEELRGRLESMLTQTQWFRDVDTGEFRDFDPNGEIPQGFEPYDDDDAQPLWVRNETNGENVTNLSRVVPELRRLVNG